MTVVFDIDPKNVPIPFSWLLEMGYSSADIARQGPSG
jgi:hypothetical protein